MAAVAETTDAGGLYPPAPDGHAGSNPASSSTPRGRGRPAILDDARRVQIQLPAELLERIDQLAEAAAMPRSQMLRAWIAERVEAALPRPQAASRP